MSYSQFGEDDILAKLLPATGHLIDVGAWEPIAMSNSRLLIERGWDATLVEFSPHPLRNLVREYNGIPQVRVVSAAITPGPRHLERFRITDDAISSNDPNTELRWKGLRENYDGGFFGDLWVPTLGVHQLLEQFYGGETQIDFVNVDTEGSSVDVALAFMREDGPWKPKVLCVEHDDKLVYLMEQAQTLGYRQHWVNGCNVILERV